MLLGLIALSLCLTQIYTLEIYSDLRLGRNDSYKLWCEIVFMPNHRGWSDNQTAKAWTNISVSIYPYIAEGFQLTASSETYRSEVSAIVPYTNVSLVEGTFQHFGFSIFYWGDVFAIYLGLLHPILTNLTTHLIVPTPFCDVSSLTLGCKI
jgi:hypothetical protein